MKYFRRIKYRILFVVAFLCLGLALFYYLFFTEGGSAFVAKKVLHGFLKAENVKIGTTSGTLSKSISFKDVKIESPKGLPPGSTLEIAEVDIYLPSHNLKSTKAEIHNGKLKIHGCEPVHFYGVYDEKSLDIHLYSKYIDVEQLTGKLVKNGLVRGLSAGISDLDLHITGSSEEPLITGRFNIDELSKGGFTAIKCLGSLSLSVKDLKKEPRFFGEINLESGIAYGPKTAVIQLQKSRISFDGDPKKPLFNMKGTSKVGRTKIDISLKGPLEKPDLKLKSEPSMSQERLLLMLATGESWKGAEQSLSSGQLSADVVKDFIDYFIFSGSGSKMAEHLGISEISLKYDDKSKGIGLRKSITDNFDASYGVEQPQSKKEEQIITHKIGGEYGVTESVSIEAEKEIKQDSVTNKIRNDVQADDKILLKYKKGF